MVDYFALAVSHGVLMLAFWRLMLRDDLDKEPPRAEVSEADLPAPKPDRKQLRRA